MDRTEQAHARRLTPGKAMGSDMSDAAEVLSNDFATRLAAIVGNDRVLTSLEDRRFFSLDFSEQPGEMRDGRSQAALVRRRCRDRPDVFARPASRSTRAAAACPTRAGHVPVRPDTIIVDATGLNRDHRDQHAGPLRHARNRRDAGPTCARRCAAPDFACPISARCRATLRPSAAACRRTRPAWAA